MKQMLWLLVSFISIQGISQTTLDSSDIDASNQKQFIIQFDVANGNITLPTKKHIKSQDSKINFYRKTLIKPVYKDVNITKDTIINGNKYTIQLKERKLVYPGDDIKKPKYLVAGRYYKPAVGSFIRLMFTNVPKNEDIRAAVDFVNQNQEAAANFNNVLNSYGGAFNETVKVDTARIIREANERDEKIKAKAKANIDSSETLKEVDKKFDDGIDEVKDKAKDFAKKLKELNENYINIQNKSNPSSKNEISLKDYKKSLADLADSIKLELEELKVKVIADTTHKFDVTAINVLIQKSEKIKSAIEDEFKKIDVKIVQSLGNEISKLNQQINTVNEDFKAQLEKFVQIHHEIDSIYKKQLVDSSVRITHLKDSLIKVYDSIYNRRTIYIQPFQVANTDLTNINLSYTKDGQVYATREIVLKNKNGFKLDFSTGFLGTGLKDENYRLYTRTGDSSIIVEDNKGKFNIGFALLAHAYFRTGSRINFAITSGFSLNGSNQTVNYVLGLGVPLGIEERFIVSAGMNFGKVKRLSNGYLPTYQTDSLSTPSAGINNYNWYRNIANTGVPLTEKWSNSYFLAITYNIGSVIGNSRKSYVLKQ